MATKKTATKRVATKTPAKKVTAKTKRPAVKKKTMAFSLIYDGESMETRIEGTGEQIVKLLSHAISEEPSLKGVLLAAVAVS